MSINTRPMEPLRAATKYLERRWNHALRLRSVGRAAGRALPGAAPTSTRHRSVAHVLVFGCLTGAVGTSGSAWAPGAAQAAPSGDPEPVRSSRAARRVLLVQNPAPAAQEAADDAAPHAGTATAKAPTTPNSFKPSAPADVASAIEVALNDSRINVDAVSPAPGQYIAVLSGSIHPREEEALRKAVQELREAGIAKIVNRVALDAEQTQADIAKSKKPPEPEEAEFWPLTFVDTALGGSEADARYGIEPMVEVLNALYGKAGSKPVAQRARNGLLLHGTRDTRAKMRRHLVFLDAPGPQVQLDVWALQLSGKRTPRLQEALRQNREEIQRAQKLVAVVPYALSEALAKTYLKRNSDPQPQWPPAYDSKEWSGWRARWQIKYAREDLRALGFDPRPTQTIPLNNALILLAMEDEQGREEVLRAAEQDLSRMAGKRIQLANLRMAYASNMSLPPHSTYHDTIASFVEAVTAFQMSLKADGESVYVERLQARVNDATKHRELRPLLPVLGEVAEAWERQPEEKKEELLRKYAQRALTRAPGEVRRTAALTDALLKVVVDAFTADVREAFLQPLMEKLTVQNTSGSGGASLAGKSRLIVTSGLQSKLSPTMAAFVETTRPAPMSMETLNLAFPGSKSAEESDSTTIETKADGTKSTTGKNVVSSKSAFEGLTGATQVLAGLNPAQAILLAGALNPPTPTFARVAPGVGIAVRPAVLADGGSARLQIDMHYGVDATTEPNASAKNVLAWPTADAVKSHEVTTDAIVGASDLLDLSSFDLSTSYPRPPGYVPVLGTLPLIGKAFQWRRKDTRLDHHSLILVHTVILPRSLDIVQFYGAATP